MITCDDVPKIVAEYKKMCTLVLCFMLMKVVTMFLPGRTNLCSGFALDRMHVHALHHHLHLDITITFTALNMCTVGLLRMRAAWLRISRSRAHSPSSATSTI
jgi:hypothetical protein